MKFLRLYGRRTLEADHDRTCISTLRCANFRGESNAAPLINVVVLFSDNFLVHSSPDTSGADLCFALHSTWSLWLLRCALAMTQFSLCSHEPPVRHDVRPIYIYVCNVHTEVWACVTAPSFMYAATCTAYLYDLCSAREAYAAKSCMALPM